jgi:CheY-like chemotaxis protein
MADSDIKALILVAEDEPLVRNLVCLALAGAGYRVLAATDGEDAVRVSRSYEGRIDLLLTDVKMPKLIGPEAALLIQRDRPEIRIVLMSGHASGLEPEASRDMLRKPFIPKQLLDRVEQELSAH